MTCKKTPGLEKVLTQKKTVRGLKKKTQNLNPRQICYKKKL